MGRFQFYGSWRFLKLVKRQELLYAVAWMFVRLIIVWATWDPIAMVEDVKYVGSPTAAVNFVWNNEREVKIYTAEGISAELEKSKLEYLQASILVTSAKRIMIPKLLLSNVNEIAKDTASLVEWICNQLPASGTLRKSIADCVKAHNNRDSPEIVNIIPYDFGFQYLLPM